MSLSRIPNSLISNRQTLLFLVSLLAVFGTVTELLAGIWDATSHLMREPELFWTTQHMFVYAGVGMIACSAILGSFLIVSNSKNKTLNKKLKIVIIGAILQITAGYADSISHDVYGIDGLVSISHLVLESGLFLSALGGFLVLSHIQNQNARKIIPFAIMSTLLSTTWIVFNLTFLFGAVILCMPVYEIFSSGCAVL
ncbi:MAG: hypothetical protein HZA82_02010 [Thaumarchaeota archaeon]|nr:hypothetical protein [Nitrososphaerota archaeon]